MSKKIFLSIFLCAQIQNLFAPYYTKPGVVSRYPLSIVPQTLRGLQIIYYLNPEQLQEKIRDRLARFEEIANNQLEAIKSNHGVQELETNDGVLQLTREVSSLPEGILPGVAAAFAETFDQYKGLRRVGSDLRSLGFEPIRIDAIRIMNSLCIKMAKIILYARDHMTELTNPWQIARSLRFCAKILIEPRGLYPTLMKDISEYAKKGLWVSTLGRAREVFERKNAEFDRELREAADGTREAMQERAARHSRVLAAKFVELEEHGVVPDSFSDFLVAKKAEYPFLEELPQGTGSEIATKIYHQLTVALVVHLGNIMEIYLDAFKLRTIFDRSLENIERFLNQDKEVQMRQINMALTPNTDSPYMPIRNLILFGGLVREYINTQNRKLESEGYQIVSAGELSPDEEEGPRERELGRQQICETIMRYLRSQGVIPPFDFDELSLKITNGAGICTLLLGEPQEYFSMLTQEQYLTHIINLIWLLYTIAVHKDQAFTEGTFIIEDPEERIFNLLLNYVKKVNPTGHNDVVMGISFNSFGYARPSSHFREFQREELKHYGIDTRFEGKPIQQVLPAQKSHILFGKIARDRLFIKIEDHGLFWDGLIGHALQFVISLLRKQTFIPLQRFLGSDDGGESRKERVPRELVKTFEELLKLPGITLDGTVQAHMFSEVKLYGFQKIHACVGQIIPTIAAAHPHSREIFVDFQRSLERYDNIEVRKGHEVIVTPADLARYSQIH